MSEGSLTRQKLIQWLLDLLERSEEAWDPSQRSFLDSLLQGQEGTKTLAELAVTSVRLRKSGLRVEDLGSLRSIHSAIEEFWDNPSAETYDNLRLAGRSLESDA